MGFAWFANLANLTVFLQIVSLVLSCLWILGQMIIHRQRLWEEVKKIIKRLRRKK